MNTNAETLKQNYYELTELKHVLMKAKQIFAEQDQLDANGDIVLQNRRFSVDMTGKWLRCPILLIIIFWVRKQREIDSWWAMKMQILQIQ